MIVACNRAAIDCAVHRAVHHDKRAEICYAAAEICLIELHIHLTKNGGFSVVVIQPAAKAAGRIVIECGFGDDETALIIDPAARLSRLSLNVTFFSSLSVPRLRMPPPCSGEFAFPSAFSFFLFRL